MEIDIEVINRGVSHRVRVELPDDTGDVEYMIDIGTQTIRNVIKKYELENPAGSDAELEAMRKKLSGEGQVCPGCAKPVHDSKEAFLSDYHGQLWHRTCAASEGIALPK